MTPKNDQQLINQARQALQINVPVYRVKVKDNTVTFYLYGHTEPLVWTKPTRKRKGSKTTA